MDFFEMKFFSLRFSRYTTGLAVMRGLEFRNSTSLAFQSSNLHVQVGT